MRNWKAYSPLRTKQWDSCKVISRGNAKAQNLGEGREESSFGDRRLETGDYCGRNQIKASAAATSMTPTVSRSHTVSVFSTIRTRSFSNMAHLGVLQLA